MPTRIAALALIGSVALAPVSARGQTRLSPSDAVAYKGFGNAVDLDHDVAVIGTYDYRNEGAGDCAYVFRWDGWVWGQEARLDDPGGGGDFFGTAVAVDADRAVVGAYHSDVVAENAGSASVFHRSEGSWGVAATLAPGDLQTYDAFGVSVDVSGDVIVVGATNTDDGATNSGSAFVYRWGGASWDLEAKLVPDPWTNGYFGMDVSVDGDVIAVGAFGDGELGSYAGAVHVYRWDGAAWTAEAKLLDPGGAAGDYLGYSVSVSGDVIVAGAYGNDDGGNAAGMAVVWSYGDADLDGTYSWEFEADLWPEGLTERDLYGISVAAAPGAILVGAVEEGVQEPYTPEHGAAYLFRRTGTEWGEERKYGATKPTEEQYFGYRVALTNSAALVGAWTENVVGTYSGATYAYGSPGDRYCGHETALPTEDYLDANNVAARANEPPPYDARTGEPLFSRRWKLDRPFPTLPSRFPAEETALAYVRTHGRRLFAPGFDSSSVQVVGQTTTEHLGLTHVSLAQRIRGIPMFDTKLVVHVDPQGRIVWLSGNLRSSSGLPPRPTLGPEDAVQAAIEDVAPGADFYPRRASGPSGVAQETVFHADRFAFTDALHGASLVAFPKVGGPRLAWQVLFHESADRRWIILVDANDGGILYRANMVRSEVPQGEVFLENPDDGGQTAVSFEGDALASPAGWLHYQPDGSFTTLGGNNACAQEDRNGDDQGGYSPWSADGQYLFGFENGYEISGGTDVDADLEAVITNVFHAVNQCHDRFYALGFREPDGNFQRDNREEGGAGEDEVHADVQDSWDRGDAYRNVASFYTPPADGAHPTSGKPRMTLQLGAAPLRLTDKGFSGDTIVHEYAHGVYVRVVGAASLDTIQGGAMSEGLGDWFAASFHDDAVHGEYASTNSETGIRMFALDANPMTYGDLCDEGCEVHDDGEIFSATLWRLRQILVAAYGLEAGRDEAEQLVMDGLKMCAGSNPSMIGMRDCLLAADDAAGSVHESAIWSAFACRGIGASAGLPGYPAVDDPDEDHPVESFDFPDGSECDSDGDRIPDEWELNPIDWDGDGITDLDLPVAGADPLHKDLFVEVDWMRLFGGGGHNHKPRAQAEEIAVEELAAMVTVSNPDGTTGVRLHLDTGGLGGGNEVAHDDDPLRANMSETVTPSEMTEQGVHWTHHVEAEHEPHPAPGRRS